MQGCKNCRTRRVKCGEEKPCCQRCVSSNRICDGYETIRIAQASTNSNGELRLKFVQPTLQLPDSTSEEQASFHYYRVHVVDRLAGLFGSDVWHDHVLANAHAEPIVRHAVIALGALERPDENGNNEQLALKYYSKSMRALHDKIPLRGRDAKRLVLVTCLLFVAFEFRHRGWSEARSHLDGGLGIVKEEDDFSATDAEPLKPLIEAFERLDIQMALFTASRLNLNRKLVRSLMLDEPRGLEFKDVNEAHRHLNLRMAAMSELVHFADAHRLTPSGMAGRGYVAFETQILQQLRSLRNWDVAMSGLREKLTSPKDVTAANILQTHEICCRLMVSTSLTDGRECLWDSYKPDFEAILDIASGLRSALPDNDRHSFTLDMGIISSVYFTALKCRDPVLRGRSIQFLRDSNFQEGAWDSRSMAVMAQSVKSVEERGLDEPQTAADIPEVNRLYRAWYDLRKSEKRLYCKRRCFELDGQWIEYSESLTSAPHLAADVPLPPRTDVKSKLEGS